MIKIQPIVREILLEELEAQFALVNGYMNMSSYAHRIRVTVEERAKKPVTITSLVVSLSRLRKEFKKEKPLIQEVSIKNITTKLPLSETVYESNPKFLEKFESLHKKISITREDLFIATIGTHEINIISSSNLADKIIKYFEIKPKIINHNLAAIGISLDPEVFGTPNVFFSLLSVTARARVNIEELISTSTELIFIITEKDFSKTVALFSELHRKI
ncbi:hypothetical protein EXS45_01075 [Candidatus Nomurabacteria bacterium]|nr:hypothetical protein [Candidatus Nomurabacteria bacterium]